MSFGRPVFQQPIFARQNERYVNSEAELRSALVDFGTAFKGTSESPRAIVIARNIYLHSPVTLSAVHSGLTIKGLSRNLGIFAATGVILPVVIDCFSSFFLIENLQIGTGTDAIGIRCTGSEVFLRDCLVYAVESFHHTTGATNLQGVTFSGTVTFISAIQSHIAGCIFQGALSLTGCSYNMFLGNYFSLTVTETNPCIGMIFTGNNFIGNVDSSLGGGHSVFVGNHLNGATLTTAGGDTSTGNHA